MNKTNGGQAVARMKEKTGEQAVAETQEITGGQAVAEMLKEYGVTHMFMVPAILRRAMAEIERRTKIKVVRTHGEKSAVYMADGYARASGRPGVCGAQVIGALNIAAGLRDAWLAHSPVIAFTGGRDPRTKFKKAYQEVDDVPSFEPVTKFNATIDSVERSAFRIAVSGTPGPVHLQFRGNEGQIDTESAVMEPLCETLYAKVPPFRPEPELTSILAALELLQKAKRPLIVAGGGVRWSGAQKEVVALAEALGIPVATSLNGKGTITDSHPLSVGVMGTYSRESANRVVQQADLIFFVGSEAGGMTTHFWQVPAVGVPTIQVDINPEVLGRTYPLKVAICGDVKVTMQRMVEHADRSTAKRRKSWNETTRSICSEWHKKYQPFLESNDVPIRPERICYELTKGLPDDAIVLVDTGHAGMWMGGMYDTRTNTQSYLRSSGHLGWAFSAGLGAKCACPDRPVVVFTGDAGFLYHIAEIETAARRGINTVTVVNNNHSGNQSKPGFDRAYEGHQSDWAREMWTFSKVNFARIAEEMGAVGMRVEDPKELPGALQRALKANRPVILDVVTDIEVIAPGAWVK